MPMTGCTPTLINEICHLTKQQRRPWQMRGVITLTFFTAMLHAFFHAFLQLTKPAWGVVYGVHGPHWFLHSRSIKSDILLMPVYRWIAVKNPWPALQVSKLRWASPSVSFLTVFFTIQIWPPNDCILRLVCLMPMAKPCLNESLCDLYICTWTAMQIINFASATQYLTEEPQSRVCAWYLHSYRRT